MSPRAEPSTSSGDSPAASTRPRRRARRWLVAAAVALFAYAAFGFLLAPRILRNLLQEKGTAALHRQVTVADVKVNPFTLAVTVTCRCRAAVPFSWRRFRKILGARRNPKAA